MSKTNKAAQDATETENTSKRDKTNFLLESIIQRMKAIVEPAYEKMAKKSRRAESNTIKTKTHEKRHVSSKESAQSISVVDRPKRKERVIREVRKATDRGIRVGTEKVPAGVEVQNNKPTASGDVITKSTVKDWKLMYISGNGDISIIGDRINTGKPGSDIPELNMLFDSIAQYVKKPKYEPGNLRAMIVRRERGIDVAMKTSGNRIHIEWGKADVALIDNLIKKIIN